MGGVLLGVRGPKGEIVVEAYQLSQRRLIGELLSCLSVRGIWV